MVINTNCAQSVVFSCKEYQNKKKQRTNIGYTEQLLVCKIDLSLFAASLFSIIVQAHSIVSFNTAFYILNVCLQYNSLHIVI